MTAAVVDKVYDGVSDAWTWLRGVLLGEWEDNRSLDQIVTDALASFVPGLGSIITLRDLLAVIFRLAKHPEKREQIDEWILLIAMLLPLIITLAGALVAGVGALVGAELGGFLRAVTLLLVKKGGVALKVIVDFFHAHGYGDVIKALREIKFASHKDALMKGFNQQLDKLVKLVKEFEARLRALHPESLPSWLPGRDALIRGLDHCTTFVQELEALRKKAVEMIPKALIELDKRLSALLAGDIKAATQVHHSVAAGKTAPEVPKLKHESGKPAMKNPEPPEPGNTRRVPERRTLALVGKREYGIVGKDGKPVGAKPYEEGVTELDHPSLDRLDWARKKQKVQDGWPDLGARKDYETFSRDLRDATVAAGSKTTFKRIVSHDAGEKMDAGAFFNRELPLDGQDMRASSAVKEGWNKNGEYVELRVPPEGDPIWKELNALQSKAAGVDVPYKEELKFWEGPAASQVYKKEIGDKAVADDWYLAGGKDQQFFDREQMALLKRRGFISERKPTNFPDYDPKAGNIVPKDGPYLEVVPLDEAVPPATKK